MIHAAAAALAVLLIFGFCFGDDIDRAAILIGLLLFAPGMAGGVPEAMKLSSEKSDSSREAGGK